MSPGMNDQDPSAKEALSKASNLSETLMQTLVAEIDSDDVTAIVLGGSYARGEATSYSDVDFLRLVREESQRQPKRYFYRDGYLISVPTRTIASYRQAITKPEQAIWVVPSMRECKILLDKEGAFSAFQQSLASFKWEALQQEANIYASTRLVLFTEYVHKALGTLLNKNALALAQASEELLYVLTEALVVQRGVLIQRGNSYYAQAQEAAGIDSAWTRYHRMLLCLEPLPTHLSLVEARGIAALRLYQETARLLHAALQPQDRDVIEQTIQVIEQAKLSALL
jgi:predicted nucleotidyltransferase